MIIGLLGLFFRFNTEILSGLLGSDMPRGDKPNAQFNWLFQNTSKYLFLSIAVGLSLALIILFIRFGFKILIFSYRNYIYNDCFCISWSIYNLLYDKKKS